MSGQFVANIQSSGNDERKINMGKVTLDMSMSLDGFITGPNASAEHPLGIGGERLHEWLFNGDTRSRYNEWFKLSESSREVFDESITTLGAIVVGRRWFDVIDGWGGNPPIPVPYFVLTHQVPEKWARAGSPFTFVTDGIESPLKRAQAAAGDKDVAVGGANVAQQCLKAGLLDEIQIDLVPVLLGDGIRLFDHLGTEHIELESTRVIQSPGVTHLRFRVIR